jgi:hypothetical protein
MRIVLKDWEFRQRPLLPKSKVRLLAVVALLALVGLFVVATLGGCISDITGAKHEVSFCDPATGKLIGTWKHNGDSAKMKGVTLHIDKDKYFRVGSMDTTDEIGSYQTQAFIKQQDTANAMWGAAMNAVLSVTGHAPIPIATTPSVFIPNASTTSSGGLDLQALLTSEGLTDEERLVLLKVLMPKARSKRATTEPATKPAGG